MLARVIELDDSHSGILHDLLGVGESPHIACFRKKAGNRYHPNSLYCKHPLCIGYTGEQIEQKIIDFLQLFLYQIVLVQQLP